MSHPSLTMIHLDSLVWQIAAMEDEELLNYLKRIGAPEAGNELVSFLAGKPIIQTDIKCSQRNQPSPPSKVICFIPCCNSKSPTGRVVSPGQAFNDLRLPNTWANLAKGRAQVSYCIKPGSKATSALYLYTGALHEVFGDIKDDIAEKILSGKLQLYIISAGYGLLDALEPALDYDEAMQGKAAALWRKQGLSEMIAEILVREKPSKVFGFFAGSNSWSEQGSKYRYFYTEGVKAALRSGLEAEAGCFYRKEVYGVRSILGGLGKAYRELFEAGYPDKSGQSVHANGKQVGNVKIGYEQLNDRRSDNNVC